MAKGKDIRGLLQARVNEGKFRMADVDPNSTPGMKGGRKKIQRDFEKHQQELFELHARLYAEHKRSLLVVLQAMDTGGKDGTITHVVRNFNPQGVMITPFKQPTPEEKRHGFLWRIRRRLPVAGDIGIFNRSHYEDVLIVRVHDLAPLNVIERRYNLINAFENLTANLGTVNVGMVQLGESSARIYDVVFDDIVVQTARIGQ